MKNFIDSVMCTNNTNKSLKKYQNFIERKIEFSLKQTLQQLVENIIFAMNDINILDNQ